MILNREIMAEYIYLVREREFLRLGEPTFKVGKTKNEPNSRLGGYPKGSEVVLFEQVECCDIKEKQILERFREVFTPKPEYGAEYFNGNVEKMLREIKNVLFPNVFEASDPKFLQKQIDEVMSRVKKLEELLENFISDAQNLENSVKVTTTTEISNRKNECPRCGKAFYNKKALTDHLNRKFPCDRHFQCKTCGQRFKTCDELDLHFLSADSICNPTKSKNHTCFRCNREFSSAKRLENHLKCCISGSPDENLD